MTAPLNPEHADRTMRVKNTHPRFTIRRHLVGYAYPQNGNVHNPTPRYTWHLLVDGKLVDSSHTKSILVAAAREHGDAYLADSPSVVASVGEDPE